MTPWLALWLLGWLAAWGWIVHRRRRILAAWPLARGVVQSAGTARSGHPTRVLRIDDGPHAGAMPTLHLPRGTPDTALPAGHALEVRLEPSLAATCAPATGGDGLGKITALCAAAALAPVVALVALSMM